MRTTIMLLGLLVMGGQAQAAGVIYQIGGQWIQPANVPVASAPSDPEDTDETGRESETERGRADVELPDLRDAIDDQDAE